MSDSDRPAGRRFWLSGDVVDWIVANVPDLKVPEEAVEQAIWWTCYRQTEMMIDDTTRHIAQLVLEGVGPFDIDDVTTHVQYWCDEVGNEGPQGSAEYIDREIEEDLRRFFISER